MKNKTNLILLFFVSSLSLFSCKKLSDYEQNPELATQKNVPLIADFFKKHGVKSQFFVIDANMESSVIGEKGTEVLFPAKCFTNSLGDTVTGSVQIELREILSKTDMVLSKATTMSNKMPLVSAGEVLVIPMLGKEILNYAKPIKISIPANSIDTNMNLYMSYGTPENNNLNWNLLRNSESYIKYNNTKRNNRSEYKYNATIKLPQPSWINIDKAFPTNIIKTLTINIDTSYVYKTAFIVIVDSFTTVLEGEPKVISFSNDPNMKSGSYQFNLPLDMKIKIIGIIIKEDGIYFNKLDLFFSKADTISFNFIKTSEEEVVKEIETLASY